MFQEAVAVDKHNQSYRGLLKQAKLELAKATKKDFYGKHWEGASCYLIIIRQQGRGSGSIDTQ